MCASWRESTQRQYQCYIEKWNSFCSERQIDPLCTTVNFVIDFLTDLFETGVGYSAINTARSALSAYTPLEGSYQVGNHPLIQDLLKGLIS